ncbi:epoxyqueuosine reductase [Adlercreutzia sp. ZJ154]|uniref:epoxyqueuosine reductase n=1 Tax=Adlercreutzia sp. ZJ154 TaxID=2709790 RepID=UPI0013EA5740|nr:epoxyqueuosine reductase [Adlercreutzia sp. ZJ154]
MSSIEKQIVRKGLELGFSNVGFSALRDYPEYLEEARSRSNYEIFAEADDALITRLSKAKTLNPWAKSIVCATLGFSSIDYPEILTRSVARTYLARVYSPQPGTVHAFQIEALASFVEGLGMRIERNQFVVPQRIACAEAGIVTFGNNNFAYTEQDGSFVILVTFLVDRELEPSGSEVRNGCPEGCSLCAKACPTGAIIGPSKLDLDRCILFNNQRFAPGAQEDIWIDMGERIHGCDVCQVKCPRNHNVLKRATEKDPFLEILAEEFDLERILVLDEVYYEKVVRPIMYNYIKDMDIFRRNAAVALGNTGDPRHLPALREAQACIDNPNVLKAIDWAIARLEK